MKASYIEISIDVEHVVIDPVLNDLTSNFVIGARVNGAQHMWHNTFLNV